METELVLLEIAKKDLEATKILFDNKLYAQAIFYFQQCIEKAIKSLGIKRKIITESDLWKEIGHKALKVFSKSYNQFRNEIVTLDFIEVGGTKYPLNKVAIEKLLKAFPRDEMEAEVSFSSEELQNIISKIIRANDWLKKFIEAVKISFSKSLDALYEIYPTDEAKREANKRQIATFVNEWNDVYSKLFSCHSNLFYLNLIFSPHSTKSRYPYLENDFNPLEIYTDKMPLIEQLSSYIKITDETLDDLEHIYTHKKLASFWAG
jgi:HEPN domain-containing protein